MSDELNMAMMQDIVSSQNTTIDELYKERDKAQEAARKALAVLRDVEFGDHETYNWGNSERQVCPICSTHKGQEHKYCELAEVIKELEEAL